jgi:hypothetical protein
LDVLLPESGELSLEPLESCELPTELLPESLELTLELLESPELSLELLESLELSLELPESLELSLELSVPESLDAKAPMGTTSMRMRKATMSFFNTGITTSPDTAQA